MIEYTVVIPLKDEAENISELIAELEPIMNGLQQPWELICVDDGSVDETKQILVALSKEKPFLRVLTFAKNFGQSGAFDAGFQAAKGEFVITLDGDRQNDPKDISKMVEVAKDYDIICGVRKNRKDPWHKKITSKMANFLRSRICQDYIQDTGCSLKIYRTECLKKIKMYNGMHRFLPALFSIEGFRIKEIPVNHRPRTKGVTKYHFFNRFFKPVVDMLAVRWMRKRHLNYEIVRDSHD